MSRASRARKIAIAAAYGGGGLGLGLAGAFGVIRTEAYLARRTIGEPTEEAPRSDGRYGADHAGDPLRMAMLGDSGAAGLGVEHGNQTPGATLSAGLAECAGRPVDLVCVARTGARSADLTGQVEQVLQHGRPDVAVIMIGANDVTHRVRPSTAVRYLDQAVRLLREAGSQVVVGTCPDLGTVEPVAQPLRYLARYWSRQLAAAQTIVVVEAGARSVSLGDILGPEFAASPAEMFGPDRFHPSVAGYASASAVLLPSVCAALGLWFGDVEELPDLSRGEGVRPVAWAAAEAVDEAGTEVAGAQVAGNDRGPRGRWALLRHRRGKGAEELVEEAAGERSAEVPETQG